MDSDFELLFNEAVRSEGNRYREIRDQILNLDADQAAGLVEKLDDPDWQIRLQAAIFTGWREEPDRYQFIRRVAYGTEPSLEPEKYQTGRPTIGAAAKAIIPLGQLYAPALLELIYKEIDAITDYAFHVCNSVIIEWKEQRAIPVYREMLLNHNISSEYRQMCIDPLLNLKADNLFSDLVLVYEDEKNDPGLRAAALVTLGYIDDNRVIPLLEVILKDETRDRRLRYAAVKGLGNTRNQGIVGILSAEYDHTGDSDMKMEIIFALNYLDSKTAIPALKNIREREKDERLRQLIDRKIQILGNM